MRTGHSLLLVAWAGFSLGGQIATAQDPQDPAVVEEPGGAQNVPAEPVDLTVEGGYDAYVQLAPGVVATTNSSGLRRDEVIRFAEGGALEGAVASELNKVFDSKHIALYIEKHDQPGEAEGAEAELKQTVGSLLSGKAITEEGWRRLSGMFDSPPDGVVWVSPADKGILPPVWAGDTRDLSKYQANYFAEMGFSYAEDKGYLGQGVQVSICEHAWLLKEEKMKQAHEDLQGTDIKLKTKVPSVEAVRNSARHGSAVLGILAAERQGSPVGIKGICSGASFRLYSESVAGADGTTTPQRREAIIAAIEGSAPGDIVLLEMQSAPFGVLGPVELKKELRGLIRKAIASDIIIVMAAGNGNLDLTDKQTDAEFRVDTGSIIVGAGLPYSGGTCSFGCYNRRDADGKIAMLQAPGRYVFTIAHRGNFRRYGTDFSRSYDNDFGGTSASAAIVAGACAVIQGAAIEIKGKRLKALAMRQLLIDTGRECAGSGVIGRVPNVEAAIGKLDELDDAKFITPK